MPKGQSLHIGLNLVDPDHYQGWSGPLTACEADAQDMQEIATSGGFSPTILLTTDATRSNVIDIMSKAADQLESGDIFFLSYSGHGGTIKDLNFDEDDNLDETWCLYDGQLVDDELYKLFGQFQSGVRIFVLSDSCHSGTVVKMAYYYGVPKNLTTSSSNTSTVYRAMPKDLERRVYRANKAFYDSILTDPTLKNAEENIKASVLLISGCQDSQLSADGPFNGLFTGTLLRVWRDGNFSGNYQEFHKNIRLSMPPDQSPNYFTVGTTSSTFEKEKPFTI